MGESLPRVPGGVRLRGDTASRPVRTLRVKMVLLGGSGVGKSSLALRFSRDEFRSTSPTVGCAYLTRLVHLPHVTLRFEIWDTAGQEKYHSVTALYYRGAHAALLVYDITKRESFLRVQVWLKELEKQTVPGSTVIWLVGNKGDLAQDRQVSVEEGLSLANDRGLSFTETSALSGDQINELLLAVEAFKYNLRLMVAVSWCNEGNLDLYTSEDSVCLMDSSLGEDTHAPAESSRHQHEEQIPQSVRQHRRTAGTSV